MSDIHVKILGFRGIKSADLVLNPLCLLAGKNHQGKSSIAQSVAAAVNRSPVPFFLSSKPDSALFNKGETKDLVNDDADGNRGGVRLWTDDDNVIQVTWPSQDVKIKGDPPQCGKVSAGLVTPIEMGDDDRAKFFSGILNSNPTKVDFLVALKEAKYPVNKETQPELDKTWEAIDISGWDSIHSKQKEAGAKKKGAWERVTSTKYGADKAANYQPAGYTDELADVTLDTLENSVAQARQKVQDLNTGAAVGEAQIQQLTADAQTETDLLAQSEPSKQAVLDAKAALDKAEIVLAPLRMPHVYGCPHCGGMAKMTFTVGGKPIVEKSDLTDADIAKMEKQRETAQAARDAADKAWAAAKTARSELAGRYKAVEGAGDRLTAAMAKTGNTEALAAAQDELRTFESQYASKKTHDEARELHKEVARNQILIDVLDSTGLRSTKLKEKLQLFNKVLAGYCETASYQPVSISDDLETSMGGRHYMLLSDSEKYRCKAVIQVAAAVYEGSNFAIFDGADILDGPGRNGLLTLLSSMAPAFHALIVMTWIQKPDRVPDLAAMEIGNSMWVSGGKCGPLPVKAVSA